MAETEQVTVTLPSDLAAAVRTAVEGGDYASTSEIVDEALRDWTVKRLAQLPGVASLRAEIEEGLADLAEGRVRDFDPDRIIERGRELFALRSRSG